MAAPSSMNPWVRIWTHPRETILSIVSTNPKSQFALLSGIYGFPFLLNIAQSLSLYVVWPIPIILLFALILCVFIGMALISLTSLLMFWSGKWLGGMAPYLHIRAAVAWSNVPNLVNIMGWLLLVAYFGGYALSPEFSQLPFTGAELAFVGILFLAQMAASVWSVVILITGLSQVQKFSVWKAVVNVVIALILMAVVIWIAMFILGIIVGSFTPVTV